MGVLTTGVVPVGKVFGPVPSNLTLSDPALLIGHMTCDNRPDIHTVKIDLTDVGGEARAGEWVPYVQPARDEREQNLEAYLKDGQLHYRATRTIGAGEEVLIWYSKELAAALGVPELMPFHIKEGGVFFCPYCMETFRYPNSLRAHMRFKCEHRRQIHPMGLTGLSGLRPPGPIPRDVDERLFPALPFDYRTANIEKATHGAFPYPGYPNFSLSLSTSAAAAASSVSAPLSSSSTSSHMSSATSPTGRMLHSPASSTSSVSIGSGGPTSHSEKYSPTRNEHSPDRNRGEHHWSSATGSASSSRASPGKRSVTGDDDGPTAKRPNNGNSDSGVDHYSTHHQRSSSGEMASVPESSPSRPRSTDSNHSGKSSPGSPYATNGSARSPIASPSELPRSHNGLPIDTKLDRNQNISTSAMADLSDDENLSAFRKVEKRSDLSPPLQSPHQANPDESLYKIPSGLQPSSTLYSPTPLNGLKTTLAGHHEKFGGAAPSGLPHPSFLPRLAMLQGSAVGMPPSMFRTSYGENLPLSMSDLYRNSLNSKFPQGAGPLGAGGAVSGGIPGLVPRSTSEKLADIHNIENNSQYAKMLFVSPHATTAAAAAAAMSMRMATNPFYKSQNPMVEKLLTTPPVPRVPAPFQLNLSQNWCAKCNATFRMTSDLVYHMRSHHKEEPQVKKKREDKLRCTVCGETFRERHHLTRHMTSHQ